MVLFQSFIIAFGCFFVDVSFLKNFSINPLFPVFTLVFFVLLSSRDKSYWSLFLAVLLGLLLDGSSLYTFPMYLILLSVIYIVNRYFIAGILSYGQAKQSLTTLGLAMTGILLANYQSFYQSFLASNWFIAELLLNVVYILVVFYLQGFVLNKFFDKYEKYLAERFR